MTKKKILLYLFTTFLSLFPAIAFADSPLTGGNDQYIVTVQNNSELIVYDINNKKLFQENLNINIERIEVCPKFPFISITGYPLGYSKKPGFSDFLDKEYFIYDISNRKKYSKYYIDEDEKRWSSSGEYTYIGGSINLLLVPTKMLRNFLNDRRDLKIDGIIIVKGHPLGGMKQKAWIGDRLYYVNGIDGMACWGLLNTKTKKNYFISCCGMIKNNIYSTKCDNSSDATKNIIRLAATMEMDNKLKVVSYDFCNDVSKIIDTEIGTAIKRK